MDEGAPKIRKPRMSKQEAEIKIINERELEAQQRLFLSLQSSHPSIATALKSHFEEYISTLVEIMKSDVRGDIIIGTELKKRIPNNSWAKLLQTLPKKDEPLSEKEKRIISKEFKRDVKKKLKGEDIN